jgi:hypothetical protein
MRHAWLAAALLAPAAALAAGEDPAEKMAELENRLLSARHITIEARLESRGVMESSLTGRTELRDRNRATAAYAGTFAGKAVDAELQSDGRSLTLRQGSERHSEAAPVEGNRALLIGLTRMGMLHNLARLGSLRAPDHAGGGVEQWLRLESFRPTTFAQSGELEGLMSFGFELVVAGTPSSTVRLWLDPATGLPRRREQIVRFDAGEMTVIESYTRFEVE